MHARDRWATPADFSLRTRGQRRSVGAAWTTTFLWLVLAVWCIHLVVNVDRLRDEVRSRDEWRFDAEQTRHRLLQFSARTQRAHASRRAGQIFLFPPGLRAALEESGLQATLPEEARRDGRLVWQWRASAAELLDAAQQLEGAQLSGPAGRPHTEMVGLIAALTQGLDNTLARLQESVRAGVEERSNRLEREWDALYVLAALCVAALGALAILIRRWRRQAAAMRVQERRFRTLVQSAQDLIWAVDNEGRWTFVNEAARRIYGYAPVEMIGRSFRDFIAPERVEKDVDAFREIKRGAPKDHYETVHIGKDNRRVTLLFNATPMRDARGRVHGTMGSATDVTHTRAMQERLLLNERLQAVATLGGGVAHDFNNLLTVIIGQTEVAMGRADLTPFLKRRFESILDTAERARKLTQQLIAFARRQPLQREIVDLVAVVRELGELARRIAGDDVRIQEVLPETSIRVVADWGQLEQVIINLVGNARDAMPEGGTVTIGLQVRTVEAAEATRLGIAPGEWAALEVADNGTGIEDENLPHIFDPFFTTKEPGKGTGLGLATVHGVVHQHGGTITVQSAAGNGTCFQILLPVANEESFKKDDETASNPTPLLGQS